MKITLEIIVLITTSFLSINIAGIKIYKRKYNLRILIAFLKCLSKIE